MKKVFALLLALVMVLGLAACGGSGSGEKVIKVGVFEPTSGQNGGGGKKEILGIEYAHSLKPTVEINGEEYEIQLVVADNASEASKAPTAAQSLLSQGVCAVVGTYGSGCAIAAGDIFANAKVPAVGTSCTNPQVTAGNDWYFRVCYIDPFQGAVMANYAATKQNCKNCALLIEAGDDYSAGFGTYFSQEMERLGGAAKVINFNKGETDFSNQIASIQKNGYDGIFAPVSIETAALIIAQARQSGLSVPIMAGDTWDDISIVQRAGEYATDVYFSAFFDVSDVNNAAGVAFAKGFTEWVAADKQRIEDNSGDPNAISSVTPCGYDAYMAVYEAIKAAQSTDGAAIRDALAALQVPGLVTGDLSFDENGDAVKSYAVIKTIQDDQIVYYDTYNG